MELPIIGSLGQLSLDNNATETIKVDQIKLSDVERLYVWLYNGYNILSWNEIIKLTAMYRVPTNIVLSKFIIQLLNDGLDVESIVFKLLEHKILLDYNVEQLKEIITIFTEYKGIKPLTPPILNKITLLANMVQPIGNAGHCDEHPSVDPVKGRPYLDWKECYYEDCHLHFESANDLIKHLKKLGKYQPSYHCAHEEAVSYRNLTPEHVLGEKMTRCPSIICNRAGHTFTPVELCNHFQQLGIPPFWSPGMAIKKCNSNATLDIQCYKQIYIDRDCNVCFEELTSTIFLPCYHNIVCLNCAAKLAKCPKCRAPIQRIIPF